MSSPAAIETPSTHDRVASAIEALLGLNGATQAALAHAIGVPESSVSKALNGHRKITVDEAEAIADFLGVPVAALYEGGDAIRARVQNWKKNTGPDLRLVEGGGTGGPSTGRTPLLIPVQ